MRDISSLAIVEKSAQQRRRPGGCMGVLFQFLEWNRRLAKKKLFSNELLTPVRAAKMASEKFGGDGKMPMAKMLLIADENCGGFPKVKKQEATSFRRPSRDDLGDEMCTPGIVARLMGLDSMPDVNREKPRKAMDAHFYDMDEGSEFPRLDQDLCLETDGRRRLKSRPQKLQKTRGVFSEKQQDSDARFVPTVLRFNKGTMPLSKKHHYHHKLASPVKSPRMISRRNSARLMEAATKILEPDLKSRSRAKGALSYMGSLQESADDETHDALSLKRSEEPSINSLVRSCKSCSGLLEVNGFTLNAKGDSTTDKESFASDSSNASLSRNGSSKSRMRQQGIPVCQRRTTSHGTQVKVGAPSNAVKLNGENRAASLAIQAKINVQGRAREMKERNYHGECKPQQDLASRTTLKQNNLRQDQPSLFKDKVAPAFKVPSRENCPRNLNGLNVARNSVILDRNLKTRKHARSTTKVLGCHRQETENSSLEKKSLSRKRRPNYTPQVENDGLTRFTSANQTSDGRNIIDGEGQHLTNVLPVSPVCVKSESSEQAEDDGATCRRNGSIVSFTFTSPMRQDSRSCSSKAMVENRRGLSEVSCDASHESLLVSDKTTGGISCQAAMTLSEDSLSALLQQKTKELSSFDQDDLPAKNAFSVTATALILEELISSLTRGVSRSEKNVDGCSDESITTDNLCNGRIEPSEVTVLHYQECETNQKSQEEAKTGVSAILLPSSSAQCSPVSILEASFSNSSVSSWSPNASSEYKLCFKPIMGSCNKSQLLRLENELLDSGSSISNQKFDTEKNICFIDNVSPMHDIFSNQAALHAQLLLGNISMYDSDEFVDSSLGPFLYSVQEAIADSSSHCLEGTLVAGLTKVGNQLRRLLFDCIIECLDSKCIIICKSGHRAWSKLLLFLGRNELAKEILEEIKWWNDMVLRALDEMIEKEMGHSTGEWTRFGIEQFETGMEIENCIIQKLVEEMVVDLSNQ